MTMYDKLIQPVDRRIAKSFLFNMKIKNVLQNLLKPWNTSETVVGCQYAFAGKNIVADIAKTAEQASKIRGPSRAVLNFEHQEHTLYSRK